VNALNVMLGFALLLVLVAAIVDLRTGHIPNPLTLGGLALGALLQMSARVLHARASERVSLPLLGHALGSVALGVLVCSVVPYLLFVRKAMGGGDVKLLAAVGGALGPVIGLETELYAFLIMALYAPLPLAFQGRLLKTLGNSVALLSNPLRPKAERLAVAPELLTSLRFGPAVFAGVAATALLRWSAR
jgi:prepilin peptidase CpaA